MRPEYEALLALKQFLDPTAAEMLDTMVAEGKDLDEINIWVNNILTKKQISTTKLRDGTEALMEYKEYYDTLGPAEKQWIKKFYYEMYGNAVYNVPEDYRLLKTEEMIKESNRIKNNLNNDIYDVQQRKGLLLSLDEERFPTELEDEYTWEQVYSAFGHECALNFLIDECLEELKIKNFDGRLALVRFYIKMNRLRLANNKDARNPKRKKK